MIDVTLDLTIDTPMFWNGYWERKRGMERPIESPNESSPTLRKYHQLLWSKELPNGEKMDLEYDPARRYIIYSDRPYLRWKDHYYVSTLIFRDLKYEMYVNKPYRKVIKKVFRSVRRYRPYYENLIRKGNTIGAALIIPQHLCNIEFMRNVNSEIAGRWDLTLECIRRYYQGELPSPISLTIEEDNDFFDLFVDFKGYVDFFFLQDFVNDDYTEVDIWFGDAPFKKCGLPETADEYFQFVEKQQTLIDKRAERIRQYCEEHNL